VLEPLDPLNPSTVRALETHRFPSLSQIYWRSPALDFSSADALLASLRVRPPHAGLRLATLADDERALLHLQSQPEAAPLLEGRDRLMLAWEVCQIPDFRQLALDDHVQLQTAIFQQLVARGSLAEDWLHQRIEPLDQVAGDVETLLARLAFIRTWTYVAHRPSWIPHAATWQARACAIEEKLSDALHAELVRRFVDSVGRRGRHRKAVREADTMRTPAAGSLAAQLVAALGPALKASRAGGLPGAGEMLSARAPEETLPVAEVEAIIAAPHDAFSLGDDGCIRFRGGRPLAKLVRGPDLRRPEVSLSLGEGQVGAGARLRLTRRLFAFARDIAPHLLASLAELPTSASPLVRGLVYQLEQGLGTLVVADAWAQLRELTADDQATLAALGVVRGRLSLYVPALLRGDSLRLRAVLCRAHFGPAERPCLPRSDELFLAVNPAVPRKAYISLGFPVVDGFAIRADVLEGLVRKARAGMPPRELARRIGCAPADGAALRAALQAALGAATDAEEGLREGA